MWFGMRLIFTQVAAGKTEFEVLGNIEITRSGVLIQCYWANYELLQEKYVEPSQSFMMEHFCETS